MFFALCLSMGAGAVICASQPPRQLFALQVPALTALLLALWMQPHSAWALALLGGVFVAFYALPLLIELRMPPAIGALLLLSQGLTWVLFSLGAARFLALHPVACAFFTACFGAFSMWLEWTIMPLWGTAQNFARGWSRAPKAAQFVAFSGVSGGVWALFFAASLLARLILAPESWLSIGLALTGVFLGLSCVNWSLWQQKSGPQTIRVAAYGWASNEFENTLALNRAVVQAAKKAAASGAKLLVTPEAAFQVENRDEFRRILCQMAAQNQLALAIGYFDTKTSQNCLDFVSSRGEIAAHYVKTHLVPFFEDYTRGQGEMAHFELDGVRLGGLICQDDNFTDLSGKYGRAKTQILAIPTHDWRFVKDFHFCNAIWRALENRFGLIKATSGGISAIVSPRGEVLAQCDHFRSGAQLLVADMPIFAPSATPCAKIRDGFVVLCGLLSLGQLAGWWDNLF